MCEAGGTTLGELVELVAYKTSAKDMSKPYLGLEHIESESGRLLGWGSAGDSSSTNCVFLQDDVLFGKLRPRLRKCVQAPFDGYCSTDILVLRARPGVVTEYAFYQAASEPTFRCAIRSEEGTRMPRTSWEAIQVARYPNHSEGEQRAIVRVLGQMDAAIRHTEQVIEKLKKIRIGLLHDLLTRGIDENGALRDPEGNPELFREVPGFGLAPRDWSSGTVSSLGIWQGGITPSKSNARFWHGGTVTWITPKDMRGGRLTDSEDKLTQFAVDTCGMAVFDEQCVAVVFRSGVLRHTFPVAMCAMPFVVNQDMKVLRPGDCVVGRYASYLIRHLERRVLQLAVKVGTTVESVDGDVFFRMPVALPHPDEQALICNRMEEIERRIDRESATAAKMRLLKHGLMQDLLTGRKRVPAGWLKPPAPTAVTDS